MSEENDSTIGDFNLDSDVKDSHIPNDDYSAIINSVIWANNKEGETDQLHFEIELSGNDKFQSDNETPIDGVKLIYKVYFPLKNHMGKFTKSGKDKYKARLQSVSIFQKNMKDVDIVTKADFTKAVEEGYWLQASVIAKVNARMGDGDYAGRIFPEVKSIKRI